MGEKQTAPSPIAAPKGFIAGATYPFRALALLIRTPELRGYVLGPILVNGLVGIGLYLGLLLPGFQAIDLWVTTLPDRLAILELLLRFLLGFFLLFGTGFLLLQFGVVLGSPWYGALAERLERLRLGPVLPEAPTGVGTFLRDIGRALLFELKKLLLLLGLGSLFFLLGWIPVIGPVIFSGGGIALATTLVCLDCLDPCLERRQLSFRKKLGVIKRSLPDSASFGLVCLFFVSVPFFNLLTIPICIAAGTLFFCDRIWPTFPPKPPYIKPD